MSEYDRDLYSASDHCYTLRENIARLDAELAAARKQGALEFADVVESALRVLEMGIAVSVVRQLRAEIEGEK